MFVEKERCGGGRETSESRELAWLNIVGAEMQVLPSSLNHPLAFKCHPAKRSMHPMVRS